MVLSSHQTITFCSLSIEYRKHVFEVLAAIDMLLIHEVNGVKY